MGAPYPCPFLRESFSTLRLITVIAIVAELFLNQADKDCVIDKDKDVEHGRLGSFSAWRSSPKS
ncbi:hypothetical protein E2562_007445 [Oryza meyeriana var. granulata]|uniref:Uncharacterized protein n=1 Tax=Oryza meyeriana var. granulata TaxID=110450 RepID=A0A6G1CYF4_9ORYZ|nr:hypothetical protein E2562_007445 [Oryza meyeriana var. granulata]